MSLFIMLSNAALKQDKINSIEPVLSHRAQLLEPVSDICSV